MLSTYALLYALAYAIIWFQICFCREAYFGTISAIKKWEPYDTIRRTIFWDAKQVQYNKHYELYEQSQIPDQAHDS